MRSNRTASNFLDSCFFRGSFCYQGGVVGRVSEIFCFLRPGKWGGTRGPAGCSWLAGCMSRGLSDPGRDVPKEGIMVHRLSSFSILSERCNCFNLDYLSHFGMSGMFLWAYMCTAQARPVSGNIMGGRITARPCSARTRVPKRTQFSVLPSRLGRRLPAIFYCHHNPRRNQQRAWLMMSRPRHVVSSEIHKTTAD